MHSKALSELRKVRQACMGLSLRSEKQKVEKVANKAIKKAKTQFRALKWVKFIYLHA